MKRLAIEFAALATIFLSSQLGCGDEAPDARCGGCAAGEKCRPGSSTKLGVAAYECVLVMKRVEVGIQGGVALEAEQTQQ